ncbi:FAD-binding protein [Thalassotalea ponticola]|uniref:electron transfer flavoprotein subunit alpha/FixB family protein n=1 Tax=Thalassotalea ponticola TaxID=1523392 RepID=UPI0025B5785E|nr:FAD-binding protein [Thalassotalea ponticola]MDN3653793.1 FAD-binding protein [Thalassotalea ponticola]
MSTLVIAEHQQGALKIDTYKAINAASQIGADIDVLVCGELLNAIADEICTISGVKRVLVLDHSDYAHQLAETTAEVVLSIAENYQHIITPATTTGKNFMPRVAARLDVCQISDICAVIDSNTFKRPIYAGNVIATVKSSDQIKVITVRSSAFDAAEHGNQAPQVVVEPVTASSKARFIDQQFNQSERPELNAANVIVSGGRGMQNGENFSLLEGVADKLGAAIGASRAAVDAGFVANDMQVGQTGKIVAPDLYIAVGISGAIQHLAGMKDSKVIVAINKDEEAPIFQVADYGLVDDLFTVLPELENAL